MSDPEPNSGANGGGRTGAFLPHEVVAAAHRGWRLHPVHPRSKKAILTGWPELATADLRKLEEMARMHPGCNWGAVAGPESGFFAVDVDDPPTMRALEDKYGDLPNGLATITARGYALIFRYADNVEIRPGTNRPCLGIDIRGAGSYIMVPPSIHPSGHRYRYNDETLPIPDCPAWLLSQILAAQKGDHAMESENPDTGITVATDTIGPGRRTPTLVSVAGKLISIGVPRDGIEAALLGLNQTFDPPHPVKKVQIIIADMSKRYPAGDNATCSGGTLRLLRGADISDEPVPWILPSHIPDRTVFGIHGRPGDGKTTIAVRIAADLSRGRTPLTGDSCRQRNVLFLSNEDSPARIKALFTGMGGDVERLYIENSDDCWWLGDLQRLELAITEAEAGYVVIDSLASHSGRTDLNKHADTTRLLVPLRALAERKGCAICVVHHLNKTPAPDHIQRVAGSIGITASFRHNLHVAPDPDDSTRRLLVNGKTNLAPPNVPALRFTIDPCEWVGTSDLTIDEVYSLPQTKTEDGGRRANGWLREVLADGEWHKAIELLEKAEKLRISERSIFRAADDLNVERERRGFGGPKYWRLPKPANVVLITAGRNGRNAETKALYTETPIPATTEDVGKNDSNGPFTCGGLLDHTDMDDDEGTLLI
jgi:hypothetical protein